jgi:hypothetical protein
MVPTSDIEEDNQSIESVSQPPVASTSHLSSASAKVCLNTRSCHTPWIAQVDIYQGE